MTTLRASEIPRMVDVDGHIDENLLRWGQGCYVRALAEVLEPRWEDEQETDQWEYQRDAYRVWAADDWNPQPPSSLDAWERDLYGVAPPVTAMRGIYGGSCGCASCRMGLTSTFTPRLGQWAASFFEASEAMERLQRQINTTFDRAFLSRWATTFDSRILYGDWNAPEPPKPVACPDVTPPTDTSVAGWALAPAAPITADRFALVPREMESPPRIAEARAFWDRPLPRRTR